jgi:hypothetical protein
MSLSSKLRGLQTISNTGDMLTPQSRLRTISSLERVCETLKDSPQGDTPTEESKDVIRRDTTDEEVPINFDVQSIVDTITDKSDKKDWTNCMFISDYELTEQVKRKLEVHITITKYDYQLFLNRNLDYLYENNITNVWLTISDKNAREYLQKNINKNKNYKVILTYRTKGRWLDDLSKYSDIILKEKDILDARALSVNELFEGLEETINRIHAPMGGLCGKLTGLLKKKTLIV